MAGENTLTGLIPTIYSALNIVSREMVGMVPAVFKDAKAIGASKDQTISVPIVPAMTSADITPAATGPDPSGVAVDKVDMTISKEKSVTFPWNGNEQMGLAANGIGGVDPLLADEFAEAIRVIVNEIEVDLAVAAYQFACRAHGTAGTTPFGSTPKLGDGADVLQILEDNGAPVTDLHLVLNSAAVANLRKLTQLTNVNESGGNEMLRRGILGDLFGMSVGQSAGIGVHTKGTGASYLTNEALAVGETAIDVDTGTGTIVAGDILTFADEAVAVKYAVNAALAAGTLSIGKPGMRNAVLEDKAVTVGANYTYNLAFHRKAIALLARVPAMPQGGDAADDVMNIVDPKSGIALQVAVYRQRRRVVYEVGAAWGVKGIKSEHIAILLG
jgi:hypothetical protein